MADAQDVVRIVYTLDIGQAVTAADDLSAALGKVSTAATDSAKPVDQVGDAAASAAKDMTAAASAASSAAEAVKKTGDAGKDSKGKLEGAADAGKKLKGALDTILPGAGAVVGALDDAADATEGLGMAAQAFGTIGGKYLAVLTGLGAAVAALGIAYKVYNAEIEKDAALKKIGAAQNAALLPSERALADARLQLQIATGKLGEEEGKEYQIRLAAQRQLLDYTAGLKKQRDQIEEQIASTKKYLDAQRGLAVAAAAVFDVTTGLGRTLGIMAREGKSLQEVIADDARALNTMFDAVTGLEAGTNTARAELASLDRQQAETTKNTKEATEATIQAERAARSRAAAEQEAAAWLARVNAEMDASAKISAASSARYYGVIDSLEAMAQAARDATRDRNESEIAEIARLRNERVKVAKETYEREFALLDGNLSAQETLHQSYQNAVTAIDADAEDARTRIFSESAEARAALEADQAERHREAIEAQVQYERESAAESLAYRQQVTRDSVALAQGYVELAGQGLSALAEKAGFAEAEVFAIRKSAALANGAILGASGILTALQTPPPLTGAAVLLAGLTAAAQLATIAATPAPSFRLGGVIDGVGGLGGAMLPDARLISAEVGEGILGRQGVEAAGGPDGVDAMNAGLSPGETRVELRLGHRTMEEVVVRQFDRPGAVRTRLQPSRAAQINPYPNRGNR
jgi:hypothetical protein